ncbi:NADH:flavin oxidoreductase/NADH oxidase family protein [Nocardia sp. IBHARD005]|uniref:NADH:flavin oxidoreductase/NADH oxidase family protein n=1 Tax=Nocardia sp. IBHARD005 TaxID=3457765 RepID=UPI004057F8D7
MIQESGDLATPLPLPCGQVLPNRIMKAALSEGLGDGSNSPTARLEKLYDSWGSGGYGLIVTGNVMVDRRQLAEPGNVAVEDDRDLDALTRWAQAARRGGSPVWMQINHPGRQSNPLLNRARPVAPSPIAMKVPGSLTPRELTGADIEEIIARFTATALIAESAGFDGVQVHAAHGYLAAQFLSPLANHRTDGWGGDPTRRMRFLLEVIRGIRAAVQPGFAIGVKLNSADFQRGGFTEAESAEVVRALVGEQVDLIEISGGSYEAPAMVGRAAAQSTVDREAYFLDYAQTVRSIAGTVPLAVTGGFRSRSAMLSAVDSAACDVIGLGRPTATMTDAAAAILHTARQRLHVPNIRITGGGLFDKLIDLKALESALDLQWHADQLHRIAEGRQPDPRRAWWKSLATLLNRHGLDALRR